MERPFLQYLQQVMHVRHEHALEMLAWVGSKELSKQERLLAAGEVCQHAFFVESGLLRMYTIDLEGKEHVVQFAPETWFIADRGSMYFATPSTYFIDAIEDSQVVFFDRHFTEKASAISVEFRNYNEYLLQHHVRQLQHRIQLLIGAQARERYLDFTKQYPNLIHRVPQWMIASFLGITPESLSRVRKEISTHKQ